MKLFAMEQPTFSVEGVEVRTASYLASSAVSELTDKTYKRFTPARNAVNPLCRALRWGVIINGQIHWTEKNTYQLSAKLNEEEGGSVRTMDLVPDSFLNHPNISRAINEIFETYFPEGSSSFEPFGVQISAIRYEPTLTKTCYPSPDRPHQDGFDNAIIVLNRTQNLVGGVTRVFSLDDKLLYEANLEAGQIVFVRDADYKHQVLPMMVDTQVHGPDAPCYRDILIVRITPVKR